jgi:hypothetical protein
MDLSWLIRVVGSLCMEGGRAMTERYPKTHIMLVDVDGTERLQEPPPDFNWMHYPEQLKIGDAVWKYVGCAEGVPGYRRVMGR